jgi:alpha-glucosidase
LQDPYGIQFWPEFKGRDGARTPMVWVTDNDNGGFSAGHPWLPVKPPHLALSVARQDRDNTSVLAHYRRALAFRRTYPSLRSGAMDDIAAVGGVTSFWRRGDEDLFCAFNLGDSPAGIALPEGNWTTIGTDLGSQTATGGRVTLAPWGVHLAKRA